MIEEKEYESKSDPEVIEFKRVIRAVLIVALIMIFVSTIWTIFLGIGYANIQTSQSLDINYEYSQKPFFNTSYSEVPESPYGPSYNLNMRQQRQTTGHYNGTYSFENDIIGLTPSDWLSYEDGGFVEVFDEIDGHSKIVHLNDTDNSDWVGFSQIITPITYGTIEYWWYIDNATDIIQYSNSGSINYNILFLISINTDLFRYRGDSGWQSTGKTALDNTWYHIRIDFECSIDGYKGLGQYEFKFFIDGEEFGNYGFWNDEDDLRLNSFDTNSVSVDYNAYIDAIGYSWDYEIINEYELDSINFVYGSLTGNIDDANIDDSNYFTLNSQFFTIDRIEAYFIFNESFPISDGLVSYRMESATESNSLRDSGQIIQEGLIIDNNFVVMTNPTSNLFNIIAGGAPFTTLVYYLRIFIINFTYQIGDNYEPYVHWYDTYEVDTWDFWWSNDDPTTRLLTGTDYFNGWSEIEDGGDGVNCLLNSVVEFVEPSTATIGLERNDFDIDIETERLEIIFGFNMKSISGTLNNYVDFKIFSYDSTEILTIYWEGDGNEIGYYNGSRNVLESGLTQDYWYWIYLDIDYITDTCYMELGEYIYDPWLELDPVGSKQGIVINNYTISLRVDDKYGLAEIEILAYADTGTTTFWLDYIGVYINEISISDEHGRYGIDTTINGEYNYEYDTGKYYYYDLWDFEINPMVKYNVFGENISIYLWKSIFLPTGAPDPQFTPIVDIKDYDGTEEYFNVGDFIYDPGERHQEYIYGGVMWFVFYNNFSFIWLDIYGLEFSDGDDIWTMEFESGFLDPDDSKFWVSNNRFYFSMTSDDVNTEFIEITFKLYDVYWQIDGNPQFTVNRSLRWGGRKDNPYLFADFKINYAYSDYNSYPLTLNYQNKNELLSQIKTIISFSLLISDNDNDISTTVEGYILAPVLFWYPGAALDIIITNYVNIIPGVALISIISLVIWGTTKKKVGNMLIVPSIALTSFLAYISDFIPLWILFIMLISCGTLIYSKWKDLFLVFTSFSTMILAFLHYGGVVDLWVFYGSFMLTIGYTIFIGVKDIKGERTIG